MILFVEETVGALIDPLRQKAGTKREGGPFDPPSVRLLLVRRGHQGPSFREPLLGQLFRQLVRRGDSVLADHDETMCHVVPDVVSTNTGLEAQLDRELVAVLRLGRVVRLEPSVRHARVLLGIRPRYYPNGVGQQLSALRHFLRLHIRLHEKEPIERGEPPFDRALLMGSDKNVNNNFITNV